jgi:ferric-dicitrate binding protein FerR (iron transport regulator)
MEHRSSGDDPPLNDDVDWIRLGRYLAGECTRSEADEVQRWIESDPANTRLVEQLRAGWQVAATPTTTWDTPAAWRRMAARLRSREPHKGLALVRGGRQLGGGPARAAVWAGAAAAVLLALGGGFWWSQSSVPSGSVSAAPAPLREVRAPIGQRAQFQLTDGTRVLLGPGSTLRYDTTSYGGSIRELLLDGQAHFTVAHDPNRLFLVRTARTVTEDLGTEFAITDYAADSAGVVVVASGTVAVRSLAADTTRPATLLRTGDQVRLDPAGRVTVRRGIDLRSSLAWTEGRLVFTDTPVGEVVTRLNRWYGADVRLGDPALATLRFTAAYGAVSEATVVREVATAVRGRVLRRGTTTLIVPLSSHQREN